MIVGEGKKIFMVKRSIIEVKVCYDLNYLYKENKISCYIQEILL